MGTDTERSVKKYETIEDMHVYGGRIDWDFRGMSLTEERQYGPELAMKARNACSAHALRNGDRFHQKMTDDGWLRVSRAPFPDGSSTRRWPFKSMEPGQTAVFRPAIARRARTACTSYAANSGRKFTTQLVDGHLHATCLTPREDGIYGDGPKQPSRRYNQFGHEKMEDKWPYARMEVGDKLVFREPWDLDLVEDLRLDANRNPGPQFTCTRSDDGTALIVERVADTGTFWEARRRSVQAHIDALTEDLI